MHPHLAFVPLWVFAIIVGGAVGAAFGGKSVRSNLLWGAIGAVLAGLVTFLIPAGRQTWAVQGYGVMMLIGFVSAVAIAEWRARQIGIKPHSVLDMGLWGVVIGLLGARIFHVAMNWEEFNPSDPEGFDWSRVGKMFKLHEGGLVFYGAFVTSIPWCYYFTRRHKLPALAFLDICVPGLVLGQAFGRIGCFLTGCCYGRICENLPWAVRFPGRTIENGATMFGSPPFEAQVKLGKIFASAPTSLPVHPSQLYASLAGFLTYAFLMTYWPRRRFDGQVLALTLIMAGATRFFEELLRTDDVPVFPSISEWMTVAQWVAIPIVLLGFGMLYWFGKKRTLYSPAVQPA